MSWDHDGGSSDSDFFFIGGSGSGNSEAGWGSLIFLLLFIVLCVVALVWAHNRKEEINRKLLAYINTNHCVIDRYIGGDQERHAVYKCDSGEKLDFDVRKEAVK